MNEGFKMSRIEHDLLYINQNIEVYSNEEKRREYLKKIAYRIPEATIPQNHIKYLQEIRDKYIEKPNVIYDIGACVLHWTNICKQFVWKDSSTEYIVFDAFSDAEFLYKECNLRYNIDVLSDEINKEVKWFENPIFPGGNSYYKEKNELVFPSDEYKIKKCNTLTSVIKSKGFPLPDIIKIDVQGCEKDIILGGKEIIKEAKHLIVELQHAHYNEDAPLYSEVIPIIEELGFKLEKPLFCNNGNDGDYHFVNINKC